MAHQRQQTVCLVREPTVEKACRTLERLQGKALLQVLGERACFYLCVFALKVLYQGKHDFPCSLCKLKMMY